MKKTIFTALVALAVLAVNAQSSPAYATEGARIGAVHGLSTEDFTIAAENTVNGVVSVKSFATPQPASYGLGFDDFFGNDPFFEYFFGGRPNQRRQPQQQEAPKEQQTGLGSGVIISRDGYIVTNNHVIDGAERLEVTLNDNRNYDAVVIGSDASTDLALIKIECAEDDLHVIPMGDSDSLRVGEWVLAVGNPFGFTSTVTSGIVSAKARNISDGQRRGDEIQSYIQTDAAVNRGNSGGALVNLKGELVGINCAIYSQTGAYAGCSFAIPTSTVSKVVDDLKRFGVVQRAVMGLTYREVTPELVKEKGIKGVNSGIYVASVEEGSAADEAGLKADDIIIALNGANTRTSAQFQGEVVKYSPGQTVVLTFIRDGQPQTARLTLRNKRGTTEVTQQHVISELGCSFAAVDADTLKELNLRHGVQVKDLEQGKMRDAGVRNGYIITSINDVKVKKPEDVNKIYKAIVDDDEEYPVMFIRGVYPDGTRKSYSIDL